MFLSSTKCKLTDQGALLQFSEPSVIPLSYPGIPKSNKLVVLVVYLPGGFHERLVTG